MHADLNRQRSVKDLLNLSILAVLYGPRRRPTCVLFAGVETLVLGDANLGQNGGLDRASPEESEFFVR